MELLQLRYFYESAKNGSFAKTAQKYDVPATSVSASVKRLEKELGCTLFTRESNKITLNDNGKKFKQSLSIVFDELKGAVDSLSSHSVDTREIKMLVRAMRTMITEHIIEYKTKHPNIAFKTVFDFDETDFEKYDIIIDEESIGYPTFKKIELLKAKVCLRAEKSSPLSEKKLSLYQLKNEHFVSIGENNGMHKILMNACKKAGFLPNIIVSSNDVWCNKRFVESGIGIGLSREYPHAKLSENVRHLNVTDFNEYQTICVYYKEISAYGNVEHFLKFLKERATL